MNDFTKGDLEDYILIRRNAIEVMIKMGIIPGIQDSIEIACLKAILEEFNSMENWFK